ncbi:MAG: 16S rRNA (adenine(1518)-N(6)/adenine(1519)-N(6))-dimethyltransferase RsmA [archaeon]
MDLTKKIRKLEGKHGFRANPVLDQYFLRNKSIIQRIARYGRIKSTETVLEIGPGPGFLTQEIAEKAGKVIAIEKDKKLKPLLDQRLKKYDNIEYIWEDCLEVDYPEFDKTISSLPFSISTPFTFKLLDYDFEKAVLVYQKEVGEKMVAEPGDSNYGRLSVMIQTYYKPKLREIISKRHFYPMPKVDSAVMILEPRGKERNKKYDKFIREVFRYRNKNLRNAMKHGFSIDRSDDRKVKDLSLEELEEVFKEIKREI